ncbi:MAG: hypothetical protein ACHQEB_07385 [Chitinophagales bacterium]
MERIGALISKLKEQFEQKADPAQMLVTVQLLQNELAQLQSQGSKTLGTSKVSVLLPNSVHITSSAYEKYAPKPADKPAMQEPDSYRVKETVLVDNGSVSLVQKNGQLDMVFDPMTEIPTLSHQSKELNDSTVSEPESLNDKLRQGKTELLEVLKETPVKDLRKAIGINDRFVFINDLFRGDESVYERSIKTINSFNIYAEAEYWINRELKVKLGWDNSKESVKQFDQLVKRRFS